MRARPSGAFCLRQRSSLAKLTTKMLFAVANADGHDRAHERRQLEVLDGLAENTGIVMNPTDDLAEGIQVQLKPTEKPNRDENAKQSFSDR
jgi:hypothetical protein